MGVDAGGLDDLEQLVADGKISPDASVEEIAAYLAGQVPTTAKAATEPDDDDAGADGKQADKAAGGTGDSPSAAESGANKGGSTSPDPAQTGEPEGPIVSEKGRTIPYGVLRGTREQLAAAQENLRQLNESRAQDAQRIADLESQLAAAKASAPSQQTTQEVQDIADRAGVTDARGNKVDVTKIDVTALRGEFPEPVVNIIEALQQALVGQQATITQLQSRESVRSSRETLTEEEQLQADIDAVPFLAKAQVDTSPHRWTAAVALDRSLSADPAWRDKSRVERFQEVARQLGAPNDEILAPTVQETAPAEAPTKTGKATPPAQVKQTVAGALSRAAARAAPTSLTDLPAGSAAAQSEAESLGTMDVTELAAKFAAMTPAQQEAYLAKHA